MKIFKNWLIISLGLISNAGLFAGDGPAAAASKIIKIGASILGKDVHTPSRSISPRDFEFRHDEAYQILASRLLKTFEQTKLDSVLIDADLFLSEACLKRPGKISKEHRAKLEAIAKNASSQSYPIAYFSRPGSS
jgi:hypothetical protein